MGTRQATGSKTLGWRTSSPLDRGFFYEYEQADALRASTRQMMPVEFVEGLPGVTDAELHNLKFEKSWAGADWGWRPCTRSRTSWRSLSGGLSSSFSCQAADDFAVEKRNHGPLSRSRHVVQLVPIKRPPKGMRGEKSKKTRGGAGREENKKKKSRGEEKEEEVPLETRSGLRRKRPRVLTMGGGVSLNNHARDVMFGRLPALDPLEPGPRFPLMGKVWNFAQSSARD